jgi:hypothetical protein
VASILPIDPGVPNQIIETVLDGVAYVLRVRWNSLENAWFLDAWESDGTTAIALGIKIVLGQNLGEGVGHPLFAAGMFAIDFSHSAVDAGFSDLGSRVVVVHLSLSESVLVSLPP